MSVTPRIPSIFATKLMAARMACLVLLGMTPVMAADDAPAEPYRAIVERNAFGLLPAASAPASAPGPVVAELPMFKLTGMYSQGDRTRVLLVKEKRGQEPERLALSKGETVGGVEVHEANAAAGSVHLRIEGVDVFLSFSGQKAEEVATRVAEEKFVDDHVRAHEELQRRETQRLDSEAKAENSSR